MFVFMLGNVSEGFKAVGTFEDFDSVCEWSEGREGWVMELACPDCGEDMHGRKVHCEAHYDAIMQDMGGKA